jgi:hypothetical protein
MTKSSTPARVGPRSLKRGIVVVLLALSLGSIIGMRGPVAHAEPISCSAHAIGYTGKWNNAAGINGYVEGWLYAWYSTYDGSYCGYMTARAHAHLNVGSPWAYMDAVVDDCSGNYKTSTSSVYLTGGGASGYEYWTTMTSHVSQGCGRGLASAGQPYTIWGYISTGNHWA